MNHLRHNWVALTKGKKNKGAKQNSSSQQPPPKQEMSERNVVQETNQTTDSPNTQSSTNLQLPLLNSCDVNIAKESSTNLNLQHSLLKSSDVNIAKESSTNLNLQHPLLKSSDVNIAKESSTNLNLQLPLLKGSDVNIAKEEGFESDDEKNNGKSSMVKVDIRGSDSEEDNAAAGGGLVKSTDSKEQKNLQRTPVPTNLHKKKNKAACSSETDLGSPLSAFCSGDSGASSSNYRVSQQDSSMLNYGNLGHIVVRLLPSEYRADRLPDGRYVLTAAAIGYLAQKLGH